MISLLPAVLTGALAVTTPAFESAADRSPRTATRNLHELLTASDRHVRAGSPRVQDLLSQALRRSRTVGLLLRDLEQTDVIVHVELARTLKSSIAGRLLFAARTVDGTRFLRVQISEDGTTNQQIAALAHELQHALEVAAAPEVRDHRTLAALYDRIGVSQEGAVYDTVAARNLGRQVLFEVGR